MAIWVNSKITVKIDDKSFEMTRDEAMQLYNSLKNALGIFENNIRGGFNWQSGHPAFVSPDIGKYEITC